MTPRSEPFGASRLERIVVLTSSYPAYDGDPSGHFVATEVEALRAAGHDVTVLAAAPAGGAQSARGVEWLEAGSAFGWPGAPSRLRERPERLLSALGFVVRAWRALARHRDATRVIAHFVVPCGWPIAAFAAPPGAALEVVLHGSDARLVARLPRALRAHVARCLRGTELRAVSAELARVAGDALGAEVAARLRVAPVPLDVSGARARDATRDELGVGPGERLVVVVGRLVADKRVGVALEALRLAGGCRVVVIGDGPELEALRRAYPEVELVGRVARPRALALIAAADALVSASRFEGAPSVVREARALGTPVVAVEAGDLAAWAENDAGLVVIPAPARGAA